jgi:signal transduction histidine kinase
MTDAAGSPPIAILLIEDNAADARLIREILQDGRSSRFHLESAEDLTKGLKRLEQGGVEVVLLDLSLPESQGLDSFLRLRDFSPHVPVVVLTGSVDEELGNRAVHLGAQDYLTKGKLDGQLLGRAIRYAIERGRIEGELRRRAEQLAEMDRRKDEFLATLAHELRNPLAPIRNSLHILRVSGANRTTDAPMLEMMERQVSHMVRLVDDLLEMSRITRGKIELRKENVDLAAIVRGAVDTSQPLIEAAGHRLMISGPPEPLTLEADPVRLTQAIANLINNAAKYTEPGGRIELTIRPESGHARISVRDNGLGIPPEQLPRVFDIFAQVDRTLNRSQGGLGIGLTLARTLIEMHGGRIIAQSEGLGMGSEFIVSLPLCSTYDAKTDGRLRSSPSASPSGSCTPPRLKRVLVVDDNHDVADSLGMLLRYLGADAQVVYDGPSAIEAVRASRPAVVLLDIGMPGMNGHDVARQLRQEPAFRDLKLIALSGWGQEEDRRRSKAAGFDDHLVKPVDAQMLQAMLDSFH